MAFEPDQPFPKGRGDSIRSKDWNDVVKEVQGRLGKGKVDRAGDTIDGDLTVMNDLFLGGQIRPPPNPESVEGSELPADTRDGLVIDGNLTVKEDLTVEGTIHGTLADDTVGSDQIADGSVGTDQLANDAVTRDKLADNAVGSDQIADGSVGADELANDAVTTNKLAGKGVTRAKLADGAVGSDQLDTRSVTNAKLGTRSVSSAKIANDAVTRAKLQDNAVGNDQLATNAVDYRTLGRLDIPREHHLRLSGWSGSGVLQVNSTNSPRVQAYAIRAAISDTTNIPFPRQAAIGGASRVDGLSGVSARASGSTPALYVQGDARVTGRVREGHLTETFVNASGHSLRRGDLVRLTGTPVSRFRGNDNLSPVIGVTLTDDAAQATIIGVVDDQPPADHNEPDTRTNPSDPTVIADGEDLSVVTLGCYAHCKVDAGPRPIRVGDLLTSSETPGHACAAEEPKLGTIVGKALEPLEEGTGYIAVFVNLQ